MEEPDENQQIYLTICNTFNDVVDFFKELRTDPCHTNVLLQPYDSSTHGNSQTSESVPLQAHKEVLAAASPFLAELMENSSTLCDCNLHISFSDFTYTQLKLLLDYIYTGEIKASKLVMEEFEKVLKELGILGTHSYIVEDNEAPKIEEGKLTQELCASQCNQTQSFFKVQDATMSENMNTDIEVKASQSSKEQMTTLEFVEENGSFIEVDHVHEGSFEVEATSSVAGEVKKVKSTSFSCDICGLSTNTKEELRIHIQVHSSKRPYVCPICQKSFRHLNVLKTHSRVHTGEKPFTCPTCNRSFAHKSTLNEHMNLHSGDRPYECEVCQRRFKQRKSLRAHRCDDAQEEVFQCEVCGRHFINRKALALHRIHHDSENGRAKEPQEKPFLCDVCARGFSNKYLLKAHQATHSEEKRFECPVCHKRFAHKKTLQVHEASHKPGGEKGPYRCAYCPKSFRYVANLDAHERIHTGHKPFECQLCNATFRQKSSLKEHLMTHGTAEKSFHCDLCEKSFQSRRQFVAHRYSHVKQTQRCPVCKKRFYNSERLAKHISLHENIDELPEPEIGAVTAHVNEDGELIITQEVNDSNQGSLILTPSSLLRVIQTPTSGDGNGSDRGVGDGGGGGDGSGGGVGGGVSSNAGAVIVSDTELNQSGVGAAEMDDGRPTQWAFEVVIEPRP